MTPQLQTAPVPHTAIERFGPYEVVRYLTAGGMADLYLVREPGRKEPLVLKRVQSRYLDNPKVVSLFLDEGEIGAMLEHPNIVRVHSSGQVQGYHYIAMEYIPGHDLVEVLRCCTQRRVPVPRDLAVALCEKVARALSHAHDLRGPDGKPLLVVHCDVSPGNVMISFQGAIKLVDFGVARAQIPLHCPERGVAGKYNYMAPEQILGAPLDRRADLFSLGVILHELTCGQRLFKGKPEVVMRQIVEEPIPSPRQVCPDYPEALEAIVMRLLERDPTRRYPTADALRVDLSAFLAQVAETHGTRYGKREMARFLRTLFVPRDDHGIDAEPQVPAEETVDVSEPPQRKDTGGLAKAEGRIDPEEAFLTRCDNPILDAPGESFKPMPRDPDRTNFLLVPGQGTGGMTTHMMGDGSTYPRREEPDTGTAALPAPKVTRVQSEKRSWRQAHNESRSKTQSGNRSETQVENRNRSLQTAKQATADPKTTAAKRLRLFVISSLALVGLLLAYYITQR